MVTPDCDVTEVSEANEDFICKPRTTSKLAIQYKVQYCPHRQNWPHLLLFQNQCSNCSKEMFIPWCGCGCGCVRAHVHKSTRNPLFSQASLKLAGILLPLLPSAGITGMHIHSFLDQYSETGQNQTNSEPGITPYSAWVRRDC